MQYQAYFCIYRFPNGVKKDISDPKYLYATTRDTEFKLPYNRGKVAYQYVIISVDRMHNESKKGVSKKIKL